jgi:hypothetical protein
VDRLLPTAGLSILAGKPKAGKSTLARQLCAAVAQGVNFLGRPCVKGKVLYVALEEKISEIAAHFREMGVSDRDELKVHCAPAPTGALSALEVVLRELSAVSLVVIDPIFKFIRVSDSNDYMQVTGGLEPLLSLARNSQAHIMAVHHMKKRDAESFGDNVLGSTAILGASDTLLALSNRNGIRRLSSCQRYGKSFEETNLMWDASNRTLSLGETVIECEERDTERVEQLLENQLLSFVSAHPNSTRQDILQAVIGRATTKNKVIRKVLETGSLAQAGAGTKGDPYRYSIVPILPETSAPEVIV